MTLEEAIKYYEEIAEEEYETAELIHDDESVYLNKETKYRQCSEEHEQLAEWLKELKEYREKELSPALTWEDLKKLNDKPIWIYEYSEFFNKWMGEWAIIYSIEEYWDGSKTLYTKEDAIYEFENMGTKWKAYKKEKIQNQ